MLPMSRLTILGILLGDKYLSLLASNLHHSEYLTLFDHQVRSELVYEFDHAHS